jgi:hypothetical protein
MLATLAFSALMVISASKELHINKIVCYEKCPVHLVGRLDFVDAYGPPDFSGKDNDNKIKIPILKLSEKIDVVEGAGFIAQNDVDKVQVDGDVSTDMNGRFISVDGVIRGATTATDIELIVIKAAKVSCISCNADPRDAR